MRGTEGRTRPSRIAINAPTISSDDRAAVDRVLCSGWIGSGPECAAFEAELSAYLGAEHVVCVSSCTAGIELLLDYLGVGPGSRAAVPAWTHPATALPLALRGAQIVLVDSDPATMSMSVDSLRTVLSSGLDVVVPVHFAGIPLPVELLEVCGAYDVPVIEDAAHAFGASDGSGYIRGRSSLAAAFSFHATKNLTCGEGGAVATADGQLGEWLRHRRNHGLDRDAWSREATGSWTMGDITAPGRKANLPDLLAAVGRSQLSRFDEMQAHRRDLVDRYRSRLAAIEGVSMIPEQACEGSADHLAIVRLPPGCRAAVVQHLEQLGISTGLHFKPLHHHSWFGAHAEVPIDGLEVCDEAADRLLTLPLHGRLSAWEVDEVVDGIEEALDVSRRCVAATVPVPPRYIDAMLSDFEADNALRFNHLGHWDEPAGEIRPGSRVLAQRRMNDVLVDFAGVVDGARVLDVGSGFGGTLEAIDEQFTDMVLAGLEVDGRQLALCNALSPSATNVIEWVQGDGCRLPFRADSFDHVVSIEAMWHFSSRREFLVECARVLRPGGRLAVVDLFVDACATERRGLAAHELREVLEPAFAPWPGIDASLDDVLGDACAAGLRCVQSMDATSQTKPTYLDHLDAVDRPGAAAFSSNPGVQLFVDLHRRDELQVVYLSFEHTDPEGTTS